MDPLSITAGIVGLVTTSSSGISKLRIILESDQEHLAEIQPYINKLQAAVTLLQTISKHLPTDETLPGVDLSLKMCMESWEHIQEIINEEHERSRNSMCTSSRLDQFTQRLPRKVDVFADWVTSLRTFSQEARMDHIVMAINHLEKMSEVGWKEQRQIMQEVDKTKLVLLEVLARETRSANNIALDNGRTLNDDGTHTTGLLSQLKAAKDATRDNSEKRQEDLNEIRAQLGRTGLGRTGTRQNTLKYNQSDEFVYNISILGGKDGARDAAFSTHCRATLDTACHDNWVSKAIIERAGLLGTIGMITDPDAFDSFSGHAMEPQGQIELTFFLATAEGSSQQTRTENFYVFDRLPVDLVLGKAFIAKQFMFVSKHALGLIMQGDFTQGEVREIEISLKEQGAANAEISSLRRAAGSAAREARRAQKAASRASTRGSTTPLG